MDKNWQSVEDYLKRIESLTLLGAKKALTISDTSLLTGLSKSHLYRLTCTKKVPHYKTDGGKLLMFDKDEITAWLLQNRIPTRNEIEQRAADYCVTGKMERARR